MKKEDMTKTKFGKMIREARNKKGWSLREAAELFVKMFDFFQDCHLSSEEIAKINDVLDEAMDRIVIGPPVKEEK